jgi:arginase family enzyme
MSTRKVLRLIQSIGCPVVGADIVEYNPDRDVNGMTAAVAAKFLKELAGAMLRQER